MYLVHVYPLLRGTPLQTLTYFSKVEYPRGAIIDVPIRRAPTPAVVARAEPVAEARTAIRRASHKILNVLVQEPRFLFLPTFLDATENLARETVGSVGAILHSTLPTTLLTMEVRFPYFNTELLQQGTSNVPCEVGTHFEELLLHAPRMERFTAYRTLVRERFAHKQSVLVLTPSVREAEQCAASIRRGLDAGRVHLIHGALSQKKFRTAWSATLTSDPPVVVIATISGMSVPRKDFGIIIVEREQTNYYIRETRPYVDVRMLARAYAHALAIPILYADSALSVSHIYKHEIGEATEYRPLAARTKDGLTSSIVDMRGYKQTTSGEYHALSDPLVSLIKTVEREQSRLFILSGRRGIASSLVCKDCGVSVVCPHCESTVALHIHKQTPVFLCHRCDSMGESTARCTSCSSWNLIALGAGSELIEKQVKKVTKLPIFRIDSDSTKTPKRCSEIADMFEKTPSILVGTEQALSHLPERIPHVAISAIDSLLAISDFAIEERIFSLLLSLRERAEKTLLIQTRSPEHPTLLKAKDGDIRGFQQHELAQRKRFAFPPYAMFVSISCFGAKSVVTKEVAKLSTMLAPYSPTLLPTQKGARRGSEIVLRIPREKWPDQKLLSLLRNLAPTWDVTIRTG